MCLLVGWRYLLNEARETAHFAQGMLTEAGIKGSSAQQKNM